MIKVLFFASLKETLDCDQLQVEATQASTVAQLREQLSKKGDIWAANLAAGSTLVAINQAMSNEASAIKSGDEVAFFPPVTGG
ncbi:MAG: molybdopterin synthase sulfur carrier subunit [Alteromonadaceae bacterium]|jgi:molybdopterin synthase sulfur carrier subunit